MWLTKSQERVRDELLGMTPGTTQNQPIRGAANSGAQLQPCQSSLRPLLQHGPEKLCSEIADQIKMWPLPPLLNDNQETREDWKPMQETHNLAGQ